MGLVDILEVKKFALNESRLWGFAVDVPKARAESEVWAVWLRGWVIGREVPVAALEVMYEGELWRRLAVDKYRSDLRIAYPQASRAEWSGFADGVTVLGMAPEFELLIRARLQDDEVLPLATIRGRREALRSPFEPALNPLMVTSLGRTGTTWLNCLLSEHPRIVAYRRYPYETFVGSYWMQALIVLSAPADHLDSSHPGHFVLNRSLIGHNPYYMEVLSPETAVEERPLSRWLGEGFVDQLAPFCQQNIDSYYSLVALKQQQPQARYFVEKYQPWFIPRIVWDLYPGAREIFLVRDFRDMVCSVLKFNAKRGYAAFGREKFESDEEYIRQLRIGLVRFLASWEERKHRCLLLRYEDLVLDAMGSLRAVLEYMGLDASDSVIRGMIERASANRALAEHRTSVDARASVERWREDLEPSLRAVCEETFGDVLEAFGYPLSGPRGDAAWASDGVVASVAGGEG